MRGIPEWGEKVNHLLSPHLVRQPAQRDSKYETCQNRGRGHGPEQVLIRPLCLVGIELEKRRGHGHREPGKRGNDDPSSQRTLSLEELPEIP